MTIRETWRDAALRDQLQYLGTYDPFTGTMTADGPSHNRPRVHGSRERSHCALTIIRSEAALPNVENLACPVCAYVRPWAHVTDLMIHLNNRHHWTWLDLANKFPPILPEDQP
ncbi:MAG TPA: hypothetical protein VJ816_08330 [Gemmatimonadales bacterium]|nr:hypothetical protein [Gemmatimonadales bacterium]